MSDHRIYRYTLPVEDFTVLHLPAGAEVLSVAPARDGSVSIDMWAWVDRDAPEEPRGFHVLGTGNPAPDRQTLGRFVGTVALLEGTFIGHVFEVRRGLGNGPF